MSLSYQHHSHFLHYQDTRGIESIHHRTKQKKKTNIAYETIVEFNKNLQYQG